MMEGAIGIFILGICSIEEGVVREKGGEVWGCEIGGSVGGRWEGKVR